MAETYEFRRLRAIFGSDGSEIREQFIFAGLLLTIFERFKKYVVDHVDGYFSDHIEICDGHLKYTRGEEFKKLIKEKGVHAPGQHANKEFRAALHWFCDLGLSPGMSSTISSASMRYGMTSGTSYFRSSRTTTRTRSNLMMC